MAGRSCWRSAVRSRGGGRVVDSVDKEGRSLMLCSERGCCFLPNYTHPGLIHTLSAHLADAVPILWHAGEPLTVGIGFYERAFDLLARFNTRNVPIQHAVQTNAT